MRHLFKKDDSAAALAIEAMLKGPVAIRWQFLRLFQ
jgi:hypothetical protein